MNHDVPHSSTLQLESVSCFNTIKDSWAVIESEGEKTNGLSYLTETFRFCRSHLTATISNVIFSVFITACICICRSVGSEFFWF